MAKTKNARGQGEGNIRERFKKTKEGKKVSIGWEARYTNGCDADGKQMQKSIYAKTRGEVAQKLTKVLNDINTGSYIEPSKITVKAWFKTWLEEYKKASVKPITYWRYEGLVRNYVEPALGKHMLKDLRPEHIQKLINDKFKEGLSSRSVLYIFTTVHNGIEQAVKNGLVFRNVTKAVNLPKSNKKEIRILTVEEEGKLLEACKAHRFGFAITLALFTGVRIGELMALKWDDIDTKEDTIKINRNMIRTKSDEKETGKKTEVIIQETLKTKAGKRSIPILDDVLPLLKAFKKQQQAEKVEFRPLYKESGFIFTDELGNHLETRYLQRLLKELLEKAEVKNVTFHALRHTFASRALERGIPAKVVQEILGHASISMTLDLYSHVLPETKKTEMQKLKGMFKLG